MTQPKRGLVVDDRPAFLGRAPRRQAAGDGLVHGADLVAAPTALIREFFPAEAGGGDG